MHQKILENFYLTGTGKSYKDILPIDEATYKELIQGADKARINRSKHGISVRYEGITKRGWISFSTNSQTFSKKRYTQYIKLQELKNVSYFKEFNSRDIIRLFLHGNISVYCSCPDFKYYGFKYMGYQMGYGIKRENRFPKIRNPQLKGTVCKHLLSVLTVLPSNWMSIARDMAKNKHFTQELV